MNSMKPLIIVIYISSIFTACSLQDNRNEVLRAKSSFGYATTTFFLTIYSDSTYTFNVQESTLNKKTTFHGECILKGDTIGFLNPNFEYLNATAAIFRNGYLEFLNGQIPFKMQITSSEFARRNGIDTLTYSNYSLFTYDSTFYHVFSGPATPCDLTNEDLAKIELILESCLQDIELSVEPKDYFKQCIAVRNANNEKEVWINLHCDSEDIDQLKYSIIRVADGGDCYLNLNINLDQGECYDISINGDA